MLKNGLLASATLAAALVVAGGSRADTVAYDAPQDTTGLYSNNQIGFATCCGLSPGGVSGPFGVGATITLAGSGAFNLTTVDLYGYAGGGALPIEVTLYSGSNPNSGALLGSEEVVPTGNGWTTEVLDFGGLRVPQTLTYIVSLVGNTGSYDDAFVNWQQFTGISGSPTTGTSGDMWYGSPGGFVADNTYAVATGAESNTLAVQFSISAFGGPTAIVAEAVGGPAPIVPEPSTWAMIGLGFAALGLVGYRKGRRPRALPD